jgi:hypothetical protein
MNYSISLPIGLKPSSQTHPIVMPVPRPGAGFCLVLDFSSWGRNGADGWERLNQLSNSGGESKSNTPSGDVLSIPKMSSLRLEVFVEIKGRNVTGSELCSKEYCVDGEDAVMALRGEDDDDEIDGVVVCKGGVKLPPFVFSSPEVDVRRGFFWLIRSVNRRDKENDFLCCTVRMAVLDFARRKRFKLEGIQEGT